MVATLRPVGPLTSRNVSGLAGRSLSIAVAVALHATCSNMFVSGGKVRLGAVFTSLTVIWKLFVVLKLVAFTASGFVSVTLTVTV